MLRLNLFLLSALLVKLSPILCCNEAICASIVSKCTLLKSCECEIVDDTPCTCCERCKMCLSYLFSECCSCFDLCKKPNITNMAQESTVFDFDEPVPSLWTALTQDQDSRWDVVTYPVDLHPTEVKSNTNGNKHKSFVVSDEEQENSLLVEQQDIVTVNCTVAFLRECTPKHKCKLACGTMGASYGRWFEDGCCQCIGHNCRNYGINESRCLDCSDEDLEDKTDDELDKIVKSLEDEVYQDQDEEIQSVDMEDDLLS